MSNSGEKTLYERQGGDDAISALVNNLLPRLMADQLLGRFRRIAAMTASLGKSNC
jgi:hypothetical protein